MSSLASLFARWLGRPAAPPSARPPAPPLAAPAAADCVLAAADGALPAIALTEVIAPHAEWLQRLRYAYGADPVAFMRDIVGAVERYAQYVHLLPATPDRHFRRAGGLLRMGLEIGFYALQAADGVMFARRQTISQRAALEPRWRYATFLAGLCSGLDVSLSQLRVSNDRGEHWCAYREPLWRWLQATQSPRYRVRWRPRAEPAGALGEVALSHIASPAIMHYFAEGNSVVIPQLIASVRGTVCTGESNTLEQLVRRSTALVIDAERSADSDREPAATGVPTPATAQFALPLPVAPPAAVANNRSPPLPPLWAREGSSIAPLPARLHPFVRAALRQILATLDSPAAPPAATITELGVFVPLREFTRRGVDPALAVRVLCEAGLLARDPRAPQSKTCAHAFAGETLLGVALVARCGCAFDERALKATPC